MAGGLGCDLVTGTSEFTARKGRIYAMYANEDDSRILNVTEEYPISVTNRVRVDKITLSGTSGTATIVCNAISRTATFATDLDTTAGNFMTANAAAYLAVGVTLTRSGPTLTFSATTANKEFSALSTITNATGDLSGRVLTEYARNTATVTGLSYMSVKRIDRITLTGTSGTATITCNALAKLATFGDDLADTAADFVTSWAANYLAVGVVVTAALGVLTFTASVAGTNFTGNTTIANASGNLAGTVANSIANVVGAINKSNLLIPDFPLTKFTPAKGSFWVYYNYEDR